MQLIIGVAIGIAMSTIYCWCVRDERRQQCIDQHPSQGRRVYFLTLPTLDLAREDFEQRVNSWYDEYQQSQSDPTKEEG